MQKQKIQRKDQLLMKNWKNPPHRKTNQSRRAILFHDGKQAVARHYWLQEQLHHEPSGNVNLDSEHYTIRVRQEYAIIAFGLMQIRSF